VPPTSIRVYRTSQKRTVKVPFRTYVETVMAAEWGRTHPLAALRVGAVAVKQFAWYYTMNWRGGRDPQGRCYDVVDTARDQVYDPSKEVSARHREAVSSTWDVSLRKGSRFFLTGYRAGTGSCLANRDGWKLYQRDASDCVKRYGWTDEKLGRVFYSSLSWITPGIGDWSGDGRGDVAVLATGPDGGTTGEVFTSDAQYRTTVASGTRTGDTLTTAADDTLLGRVAGDVTGDGRRDIVQLVRTVDGAALQVIRGTVSGLAPAATWWSQAGDATNVGGGDLRLIVGDFTGEGRDDAAIVRVATGDTSGATVFLARSTGSRFGDVRRIGSTAVDLAGSALLAGDGNGDGIGDLVAVSPAADGGSLLRVARATKDRVLGSLATWGSDAHGPADLRPMMGDVNRDGRSDLLLARRAGDGVRIVAHRSPRTGTGFSRTYLTGTLEIPFGSTRFAAADADADGRADVYALVDRGTDADGNPLGADVWRLLSNASGTLDASRWLTDVALDWETSVPY
jgi:hypothetical protein